MKYVYKYRHHVAVLGLFLLTMMLAGTASAVEINLCAAETVKTMPDGDPVTVWGFGMDTGGPCTPTVSGPVLRVPWDDATLIVHLRNTLSEPVSLHILGQQLSNNSGPVWDDGATGSRTVGNYTARVRSFSHEAPANGGTADYQWDSFRPGTYLLQSGTDPAKQVLMGLSAPVVKDAALDTAYADDPNTPIDESVPYDQDLVLVYQEIDPDIHAAVADGNYGAGGTITSSIYREPRYYLINGMGYPDDGLNPIETANPIQVGQRLLLRFINAGAETHIPQLLGDYMTVVAEDGNAYKHAKESYSFELNAAKTMDALYVPSQSIRLPILDGRLRLTNGGVSPGGMLAYLNVDGAVDNVDISNVVYDSQAQTLMIVATSSAASNGTANVQLSAQGYGPLAWKSWLNIFRNTFSNVASRPDSIFVSSSGGGSATYNFPVEDTVSISSVTYNAASQTMTVVATSNRQPDVQLTAEGLGSLGWKSWLNFYRGTFPVGANPPATVTVTSSDGGSDTYTADTVTIQNVILNGGNMTVIATSSRQPGVQLTAEGWGALGWKSWLNFYRNTFPVGANPPATVTVTSSDGGSDTWNLQ